ncbi:surface-associated interspersed protein (SURFIN), fragment [Plasmodium gallinaceum]|uniref:Surface-associated interspersed protein (SURFIN) n=1 Tax=Plasmodium gallinaceum TaxID=5849 RepID=A0A1J1GPS0_PLAGA|nr:surface-associated interspersed protein (SURFIN), fragment [Plasmodium gallinaceum]CRG94509.1 surface-associated interspersed protein (SURFIN), fragment [Plasmodium gallinaceum]
MKKNSTSKNARLLSQLEEISCMSNQGNNAIENNATLSNDIIKLNTEIQSFMDDTRNELQFYLEDNKITNDTEKCQKASSYINWRGMDYVNLLLSERENYNISCVVEKWNEKQKSLQTSIDEKMKTCSTTTFDYCAILNKNDKCTRPYEYNDLPVSTLLTYDKLKEDTYSSNKTQIIGDRWSMFNNITNDISDYYYRMYENENSELNCGKWSMYIYKRGKQFIKMAAKELYEEEIYVNDSITRWNQHSNILQYTVLEDTGNQCNMTTFIHQIKEQQNSNNPYDLSGLFSKKNRNEPNGTIYNTTPLPDNLQPTTVTPNVLHNDTTTGLLGGKTTSVNIVNGVNSSENTFTGVTSVSSMTTDQTSPETETTISPENSTQSNSLTQNDTIYSNTNTISNTTSTSPFPEIVSSPTTKTLSSNSTTSSGTPAVIHLPGDISATATNEYSDTTMKTFTNNITASTTSTKSPATSLPSETVTFVNKNISTNGNTSVTNDTASPMNNPLPSPEIAPSLTTMTTTPTDSSTTPLPSSIPKITTLPSTNYSISPTKDMSILPTKEVTHKTAISPLTHSSTFFSTNTIENSTTTIEPFTNKIASSTIDATTLAINTTSLMSDIISPTPLSYSPDNTPILTTTTAFFPITNNNLPSNQTDSTQLQIPPNTHVPFKQVQQHVYERNCTGNISLCQSATDPNTFKPIPSSDPNEVMPTVKPTDNLLIPMVSGGIFLLGIIFLLILLCKYTPIGSWIRNRKSKKKKARKKIKKITREPLLMDTNNTKNEPINNQNYSFLHHEKEIPQCDMSLKNRKDLKYKQVKKSKAPKGMYMENEKYFKYEHMKKSKPHEGMHMENENKCIREAVEVSKKHENEFILREKLNEDNPRNEIKDELNKNRLEENPVHIVGYIRKDTLNEEKANEINSHKKKKKKKKKEKKLK